MVDPEDPGGGAHGCGEVARDLERWLERRGPKPDLERIGVHTRRCPRCYARLSHFFRTVELPEPGYLRETIDELAFSLLNLARAIIRDRPPDPAEEDAAVLAITRSGGGSAEENAESGSEMIDDAEDYAGSSIIGGLNLAALRDLLSDAGRAQGLRVELALGLFHRVTELESRYEAEAWNWIAALEYRRERLDAAERACRRTLACRRGVEQARSFAQCTLAYILKHRGRLDQAVTAARRSVVLAEEDGKDPYFGRFAEMYLRLLRGGEGDLREAGGIFEALLGTEEGRVRLERDLQEDANRPVLEALRRTSLARVLEGEDAGTGPDPGS